MFKIVQNGIELTPPGEYGGKVVINNDHISVEAVHNPKERSVDISYNGLKLTGPNGVVDDDDTACFEVTKGNVLIGSCGGSFVKFGNCSLILENSSVFHNIRKSVEVGGYEDVYVHNGSTNSHWGAHTYFSDDETLTYILPDKQVQGDEYEIIVGTKVCILKPYKDKQLRVVSGGCVSIPTVDNGCVLTPNSMWRIIAVSNSLFIATKISD